MSCPGLHCAGCGAGAGVPPAALAAAFGLAWVAEHLIEVAVVSAACGALAVAAVVALARWQERREARYAAARGIRSRADAIAPAAPRAVAGARPAAIENHYHVHHHYADGREAARAISEGK